MVSSRIALVVVITLLAATAAFSQDQLKEPSPPQSPTRDTSQSKASAPKPKRLRVGGNVAAAQLIHQVTPVYPAAAKEQRVEGTVLLHAIIGKDGTLQNLMYVSGPPILMSSAIEAVKQWQYKPTLLMGEPVEVDTTISVVYRLGGSALKDPEKSNLPPATPPAELPPAPVVLAEVGPAYADSSDGMYKQFVTVLAAWKSGDEQKFKSFRDGFVLPDPKAWLAQTFGADQGAALLPTYEQSLEKFNSHIAWVSGNWANAPDLAVGVESSELPKPPAESGPESTLPKPVVIPRIENFRFRIAGGERGLESSVFSFVYVEGAFRIIGGTLTFWNEPLQGMRAPKPIEIEGVAINCPDDGLVRVFVSAKIQASRLLETVEPAYPEGAKKAGIEGTVLFHAIIARDGTVEELTLEDGDPILAKAAEEAVKRWRYDVTPYVGRVNQHPRMAEVDTAIAVEFKLPK
jgi:TonB family protein